MEIIRNEEQNQFETRKDGHVAVAQYQLSGDVMTITHILVPRAIEGQGVASALCQFIVQTARDEEWTLVPQCPFMAAYLRRHPESNDVRAA